MTAYRQRAIACAEALRAGPLRPRDLKPVAEDASAILYRNVYGWFERVKPGVYRLSTVGEASLIEKLVDEAQPHGSHPFARQEPA